LEILTKSDRGVSSFTNVSPPNKLTGVFLCYWDRWAYRRVIVMALRPSNS